MKGLDNSTYLLLYAIFNLVALAMLWAALRHRRVLRLMFFLLFAWASWTNWTAAIRSPEFYVDYADLAFLDFYKTFIRGWFSRHITWVVGVIATCQALIAIAMLLRGTILKVGAIGAIVFLLAIVPLGVGSAFPCTLVMAIAMLAVLREKDATYLWVAHPTPCLVDSGFGRQKLFSETEAHSSRKSC